MRQLETYQYGRVIWHRMRPHYAFLWMALGVAVIGLLLVLAMREPSVVGDLETRGHVCATLGLTVAVAGTMAIAGTSRMWFRHLWHRDR